MCSRYPDDETQGGFIFDHLEQTNKSCCICSEGDHIIVVRLNTHTGCMMSQSISDKSVISTANVCLGGAGKKVTAGMRCVKRQ